MSEELRKDGISGEYQRPKLVTADALIEAWHRYSYWFGDKPRGTDKQLRAVFELIPQCEDPELVIALANLISVIEQLIPEPSARGVADVVLAQARAVLKKYVTPRAMADEMNVTEKR